MSKSILANPSELRVVFDTNIYIAAFLRPGMSEELLNRGMQGDFLLYSSPYILKELQEKLLQKAQVPETIVEQFLELLTSRIQLVEPLQVRPIVREDPDDDPILACALAVKANLLITLDQHLLRLKTYQGISIMHPKTFSWIV